MTGVGDAPGGLALRDFAGAWAIERRIDDFALGRVGTLSGTAMLSPAPWGLAYYEQGLLQMENAPPMQAERHYRWAQQQGRIDVRFDDGGHFHHFTPSIGRAAATHLCGEDEYRVIYTLTRWPDWRAEWRVRGPRKDYRMVTEYTRP